MKNKFQLIATFIVSAIFTTSLINNVIADEDTGYGKLKSALSDVRALYRADKAEIIIDQLKMTKTENKAFWPVYNAYANEIKTVGNKMIKLISGYAANASKLTDDYADKMINDYIEIKDGKQDILEKYIPKFKKVLPATKVAKLYQIENKLTAVTDLEIAANVPMIK